MTKIADQKTAQRKAAFARRKTAHTQGLDGGGCTTLTACLEDLGENKTIAAYMPIRTEINPLAVMANLVDRGTCVCIPVIVATDEALKFARWTPDTPMVDGPFGAAIPAAPEFVTPHIIVTPLLAFDADGFRLGYGGGFYDRSFAQLRAGQDAIGIGFAYSAQQVDRVVTEPTDQRLDMIVTERGLLKI